MPINIREARKTLSISQSQFSEMSGIPQHKLSMLELGKDFPSEGEVRMIEETLSQIREGRLNVRRKRASHSALPFWSISSQKYLSVEKIRPLQSSESIGR